MGNIEKLIIENCTNKGTICIVGTSLDLYSGDIFKHFNNVIICEPNSKNFNKLIEVTANLSNVDPRQNVAFNESKDFVFVVKDNGKKELYTSTSITIDSLNYKIDCILINASIFQKFIILGAIDKIRYSQPFLIIKKTDDNKEVLELLREVFSYSIKFEDEKYLYLIHWTKI